MLKFILLIISFFSFNLFACYDVVDVKLENQLSIAKFTINHRLNFVGKKGKLTIKNVTSPIKQNISKAFIFGTDSLLRVEDDNLPGGEYLITLQEDDKDYLIKIILDKSTVKSRTKTRGGSCAGPLDIKVDSSK